LDVAALEKQLESLKWHLWHGNVYRALQIIEDLECDLDSPAERSERAKKLLKSVSEFHHYIEANRAFIPNYGDRYRHGERIATSFAESTVNQVISKRMVKKQQMRWTPRGAHLLLQVRTRVLNDALRPTFERWYPGLKPDIEPTRDAAA
ncbi:MAG: ISKra4 family transposase, partial [Singulisphaera sp.]|nr:ISKra4 family transposase [Singulisphaera sp.]